MKAFMRAVMMVGAIAVTAGWAAAQDAAAPDSEWVLDANPQGGLADTNPSAPEKGSFGFKTFNSGYHKVCEAAAKLLKAPVSQGLNQGAPEGFGTGENVGISAARGLARYPSGELALTDETDLGVGVDLGEQQSRVPVPGQDLSLGISVHSAIKGISVVVRPLHNRDSCDGLKTELELYHYKTVLPLTANRIRDMKVGELWKMSQELTIGIGVAGGVPLSPSPAAGLTLGFSGSRDRTVLASLYRVDEKTIRLRFRLSRVRVLSAEGGASLAIIPVPDIGKPLAEEVLAKFLPEMAVKPASKAAAGAVAHAISEYLYASLNLSAAKTEGNELLLEYLVDTGDPRQMDGLVAGLKGNLEIFRLLRTSVEDTVSLGGFGESASHSLLGREEKSLTGSLGHGPTYAEGQASLAKARQVAVHLPLVVDFDSSQEEGSAQIYSFDKTQGEYRSHTAKEDANAKYVSIPIMGHYFVRQDQRELKAIAYYDGSGQGRAPLAVYVRQYGFTHSSADAVRAQLGQINDVMRYAGTRGRGPNPRQEVPLPEIVPASSDFKYDKGTLAFTLVFSPKALADIESAAPKEILAAYAGAMSEAGKKAFAKTLKYLTVSDAGVAVDPAVYDLPADPLWGSSPLAVMANGTQLLVRDVLKIRAAKTEDERAKALRDLYDTKGYFSNPEMVLKILTQLADAHDLAAELTVNLVRHLDKNTVKDALGQEKKENEVKRYLFNGKQYQDPDIQEVSRRQSRLAQASPLQD